MKIVESIMTKNPCYTAGKKITVKGLMLHSVGCAQPKATAFINSWDKASYSSACVHAFIDGNDGTVYQTLPWNHRGWHCGSGSKGSGNDTHIGVEICEPACIKYTSGTSFTCSDKEAAKASVKKTYEAAVELFAMLCKQYGLNPMADGVIISHKEGNARGIASNHGDPEHLWNGLGMEYTMDGFRKAVKAAMGGTAANFGNSSASGTSDMYRVRKSWSDASSQIGAYTVLDNAKKCADQNSGYSVFDKSGSKVYPEASTTTTVEFDEKVDAGVAVSKPSAPSYKVGNIYHLQVELKVRTGPGTKYRAKTYGELTANGKKHDKDRDGALDAGTAVTCQEVRKDGSDIWIRVPSGWIAAYYQGKVYIK